MCAFIKDYLMLSRPYFEAILSGQAIGAICHVTFKSFNSSILILHFNQGLLICSVWLLTCRYLSFLIAYKEKLFYTHLLLWDWKFVTGRFAKISKGENNLPRKI